MSVLAVWSIARQRDREEDGFYLSATAALLPGEVMTIGLCGLFGSNSVLCCCCPLPCWEDAVDWLGDDWLASGRINTPGCELPYPAGGDWCVIEFVFAYVFGYEVEWDETLGVCLPSSESQIDIFLPVLQSSSKYLSVLKRAVCWKTRSSEHHRSPRKTVSSGR